METFHLLHLALCWPRKSNPPPPGKPGPPPPPPPCEPAEAHAVDSLVPPATNPVPQSLSIPHITAAEITGPRIRAAAVQMIFADRSSQTFITPGQVHALENDVAIGLLEAIIAYDIPEAVRCLIGGRHGATQSD